MFESAGSVWVLFVVVVVEVALLVWFITRVEALTRSAKEASSALRDIAQRLERLPTEEKKSTAAATKKSWGPGSLAPDLDSTLRLERDDDGHYVRPEGSAEFGSCPECSARGPVGAACSMRSCASLGYKYTADKT